MGLCAWLVCTRSMRGFVTYIQFICIYTYMHARVQTCAYTHTVYMYIYTMYLAFSKLTATRTNSYKYPHACKCTALPLMAMHRPFPYTVQPWTGQMHARTEQAKTLRTYVHAFSRAYASPKTVLLCVRTPKPTSNKCPRKQHPS